MPAGWRRLAWRTGGLGLLIVPEGQVTRTAGIWLLFAAAAGAAAWGAWPGSSVSHGAAVQGGIIITLALLVGLPLLARWRLGPPGNRAARWLRRGCYAAILAWMPAQAAIGMFVGAVPRSGIDRHIFDIVQGPGVPGSVSGGPDWGGEVAILILVACYLALILALTARRTPVTPATLAWVLLFAAPLVAGAIAGRCCYVPDDPGEAAVARMWQGLAAGVVSGGVAALFVTVSGNGSVALLVKSAWVRDWLYHGQHVTASAAYGRELFASQNVGAYALLLIGFPIIGFVMGLIGMACANPVHSLPDSAGELAGLGQR